MADDIAPAVAPAPAAPSPSPSPSPAPAAAPAAAPSAAPSTVLDSFDKQFEIDDAPAAPATPTPPAATKPAVPATKPPEAATKPPESGTPPPEGESFDAPQTGTIGDIRKWGRRMAQMATNATNRAKELQNEIEQLKQAGPQMPPDVAKIQEANVALQREVQEHRARIAEADYSKSPEYEEKYLAPYKQAYLRGHAVVKGLVVTEKDETTGQVTTRRGTERDFDTLYNMSDSDADRAAEAMFGASARRVIAMRDTAKERGEMAYTAVKENTTKFAEAQKQRQAQTAQQRMALAGLFRKVHEDLQKKHAEWFGTKDDDNEWNEALTKGRQIANQRFTEAYAKMAPEQRVVLDAQIYNRASAFPALVVRVKRLQAQLAEAQKGMEQLRGSGPGKPTPTTADKAGGDKGWEAELDARL